MSFSIINDEQFDSPTGPPNWEEVETFVSKSLGTESAIFLFSPFSTRNHNHAINPNEGSNLICSLQSHISQLFVTNGPYSFSIVEGEGGKILHQDGRTIASASVSHSSGLTFAVVTEPNLSIGIDVEPLGREVGRETLESLLNQQVNVSGNYISDSPDDLVLWTAMEAVCKATGHGLSVSNELTFTDEKTWNWNDVAFNVISWNQKIIENDFQFSLALESNSS